MAKAILIVDDIRDLHDVFPKTEFHRDNALGFDLDDLIIIARTYSAAIEMLNANIRWNVIFLDHDLGFNKDNKTGYDFICELERKFFEEGYRLPDDIVCVSSNPSGKLRIIAAWNRIKKEAIERTTEE